MPKITVERERCKGCELCMPVCPKKILQVDAGYINAKGYHPVMVTDDEACIACCSCATICPDYVFTIGSED